MFTTLLSYDGINVKKLHVENPKTSCIWSFRTFVNLLEQTLRNDFYITDSYHEDQRLIIIVNEMGKYSFPYKDLLEQYYYYLSKIITDNNIPKEYTQYHNQLIMFAVINLLVASFGKMLIGG